QCAYLHADETPVKVIDKGKKGETHKGYYWVYQNSIDKLVLFDYQESRGREGPVEILKDFKGYLQTDGYVAYDVFAKRQGITLIRCVEQGRGRYNEALHHEEPPASHACQEIPKSSGIERSCRESSMGSEEVKPGRQAESVPILTAPGQWMKEQYTHTLP